ncbi:MAG: polysaccharide deacetylase family protein [Cytophagaceae bacterium]|jgi:peptidoglycan/xylan/chitin deacetylase (PgdA/CDA1 family)|nr:polysaccharide deacetylase family protein [Cytophagaceae bacterium]
MKVITTSWDDGHPLDFKLADLLDKYGLSGTFYVPHSNHEHEVMNERQVQQLSTRFEIGGHTMNHVRLHSRDERVLTREIKGCFDWLHELTGDVPVSFCFPGGVFHSLAEQVARDSGFQYLRSTELLRLNFNAGLIAPTTLQLYPHTRITYIKHLLKRYRFDSLAQLSFRYRSVELTELLHTFLQKLENEGGCFHLWGHSWEIEEFQLWPLLENVFKVLAQYSDIEKVSNKELLQKM